MALNESFYRIELSFFLIAMYKSATGLESREFYYIPSSGSADFTRNLHLLLFGKIISGGFR